MPSDDIEALLATKRKDCPPAPEHFRIAPNQDILTKVDLIAGFYRSMAKKIPQQEFLDFVKLFTEAGDEIRNLRTENFLLKSKARGGG